MTKSTRNSKKRDQSDEETTSTMVMDMLGVGLEGLRAHIDNAAQAITDSEEAADLAHLLTKVAMVAGELRKAEKAARQADGEVSPPQMLDRIRRMSPAERQAFLRAAQHVDQDHGKSGLA